MAIANPTAGTAYHEAGHAVASVALQGAVRSVTIIPTTDYLGLVTHYRTRKRYANIEVSRDVRTRKYIEREVIVFYAGEIAEAKYLRKRATIKLCGSYCDHVQAFDFASTMCGSPVETEAFCNWLYVRAKDIIDIHWYQVEAVAKELLRHKSLTGKRVRQICA